jgi:hypothetical protein
MQGDNYLSELWGKGWFDLNDIFIAEVNKK